ncbi:MAG: T9SS type A sorting domain-containing protein [Bacteroidetes bacterium]|nr:MAG: T9SS type A sorting domain-containing protein [Bacteroidota bacterium]
MKNFIIILLLLTSTICYSKSIKWRKVFQADNAHFISIDNPDSNYCMAIATNVTYKEIVKSTDGGETWFHVYKDTTDPGKWKKYGRDISYPSQDFCIIGLDSNAFLKTTDGGLTWNEFEVDIPYSPYGFYDVDMYDENNGILVSSYYIALTNDGFNTYELIPNPGGFVAYCAELAAPNSICIVSRDIDGSPDFNERFFRSDNGGKTWNEYEHPDYRIPMELQFVDSLNGYEVGGKRTGSGDQRTNLVYKTTDGGRTWEKVFDTVIYISFGLQKLDFYDKDNGIVVGQFGSVFWTHDGGKSWIFDSSGLIWDNIPATMNVCYIRKDRAIVADYNGRIFISEFVDDVEDEIPNDDDFVVYPNPATDKIRIRFKDEFLNSTELQIFNSYGQEIINKSPQDFGLPTSGFRLLELDISSLSSGVYFVIINANGKVSSKPFVVMR